MRKIIIITALAVLSIGIFVGCNNSKKKTSSPNTSSIDINDSLPGRKVMEFNADSTPKVVFFYKIDEDGNMTNEKTREVYYYQGKKKYIEGNILHDQRNGEWKAYFQNGNVQTSAFYIEGKEDGEYTVYYENGKPLYIGHFDNGICVGKWDFYNQDGTLQKSIEADSQTVVCGYCDKCKMLKKK